MSTEARRTPVPPSDAGGAEGPKAVPPSPPPPAASARFPDTPPEASPPSPAPAASAAPAAPAAPSEPAGAPPSFTLSAPFRVPRAPAGDPDTGTLEVRTDARKAPGGPAAGPAPFRVPLAPAGDPDTGTLEVRANPRKASGRPGPAPTPHDGSTAITSAGLPQPPAHAPAPPSAPVPPPPYTAPADPAATGAGHTVAGAGQGHGGRWAFTGAGGRAGRPRSRKAAVAACAVLGLGLIGGAVTGTWLTGDSSPAGSAASFAQAAELWHDVPVNQLFPPVVHGSNAGPGGADRTWTRIAVAPDSDCTGAFDPLLQKALAPVGCLRLLRATYTDATGSYVTTVGLLFTRADSAGMRALHSRFTTEGLARRTDLMPRTYPAKGTPAARFGDAQRASWTVSVRTDAPLVVYAVSGWADGRTVQDAQPAGDAVKPTATTAPAQAGLGYEARGLAARVESGLRKRIDGKERP